MYGEPELQCAGGSPGLAEGGILPSARGRPGVFGRCGQRHFQQNYFEVSILLQLVELDLQCWMWEVSINSIAIRVLISLKTL